MNLGWIIARDHGMPQPSLLVAIANDNGSGIVVRHGQEGNVLGSAGDVVGDIAFECGKLAALKVGQEGVAVIAVGGGGNWDGRGRCREREGGGGGEEAE